MVKNTHSIRSFMESFKKKLRECLESGREICIFAIENVKRYKFRELNLIEVKEVIEVIASLEVNDVC